MMAIRTACSSLAVSRPRPFSNRLILDVEMPVASEISTWDIPAFSRSTFNELAPTAVRKPSTDHRGEGQAWVSPIGNHSCFFAGQFFGVPIGVLTDKVGLREVTAAGLAFP